MCWLWHGSLCSGAPPATFAASLPPSAPMAIRNRMKPNLRVREPPSFRSAPGGNSSPACGDGTWRQHGGTRHTAHVFGWAPVSPEQSPPLGSAHEERVAGSAALSPRHARSEHRRRRPVDSSPVRGCQKRSRCQPPGQPCASFGGLGGAFVRLTLPPLGEARSAHGDEPSFWRARADRPWGAAALARFGTTASRALPAKPRRALATVGRSRSPRRRLPTFISLFPLGG